MGRVIFSIVVLVVIGALIVLNAGAVTTFNLFGATFPDVPVIVVAIGGFVVGALYSFVFYLMRAVAKLRRTRLQGKTDRLQVRVHEAEAAAEQAQAAAQQAAAEKAAAEKAAAEQTAAQPPARRSLFSRLFGGPTGDPGD